MNTDDLARLLWNFLSDQQPLKSADAILAMGSMDIRVAERAAELWHQQLAPVIVPTGGIGRHTAHDPAGGEARQFAAVLERLRVPRQAILVEDQATNGAENWKLPVGLLEARGEHPTKLIAVTMPYMVKRALATGQKLLPDIALIMTSPQISYEAYPNDILTKDTIISIMVGEIERLKQYPAKGFIIEVPIPESVLAAQQKLLELDFTSQMP